MWQRAGVVRSSDDLEEALAQIEDIRSGSRKCKVETPGDLMRSIGLQNMLILSEMVCRSALLRTESRGSHFRSDFPQEDNANWLKNIVIRKENDEMVVEKHPVKLDYVSPE
jgi:succinate dehydrogenase/fumarate reductase flavoprotein subunit